LTRICAWGNGSANDSANVRRLDSAGRNSSSPQIGRERYNAERSRFSRASTGPPATRHVYRLDRRPRPAHLVWEVVDNSIDEAMAATRPCRVRVLEDGSVRVTDDGRGVPVGATPAQDALEIVHTVLHAGSKFGGGGYKVSGGLHGVGVSVVNALSESLRVESARDGSVGPGVLPGVPTTPVRKIGPQGTARARPRPSRRSRRFETIEFSFDMIAQRLRESPPEQRPWIRLLDDRAERERSFISRWPRLFCPHLNKNKEPSTPGVYVERREARVHRSRAQYNDSYTENVFSFATTSTRSTAART